MAVILLKETLKGQTDPKGFVDPVEGHTHHHIMHIHIYYDIL